jgi:hypothetical protein
MNSGPVDLCYIFSYITHLWQSTQDIMSATLQDQFGRRIDYVRLSVTDRCDLRCSYCIPEGFTGFEEPEHWLNFDEIERLIGAFARLGVSRIRLTGGEPLLRRDISGLAGRIAALPCIVHGLEWGYRGFLRLRRVWRKDADACPLPDNTRF